jgi:hypothetical protein
MNEHGIENKNSLYSLISLDDFKGVLGIDDRDEKLAKFCLVTSTCTIEQFCYRKFLRKKYFEIVDVTPDLIMPLKEYPVNKVLAVFVVGNGEFLEPEFYCVIPDCGSDYDLPFSISLSPAAARMGCKAVKVVYWAGYSNNREQRTNNKEKRGIDIPADLGAACLELAAWNMGRYKGRRVGMSGNIKGAGVQGEHFEMAIPENVRALIETYKRKLI